MLITSITPRDSRGIQLEVALRMRHALLYLFLICNAMVTAFMDIANLPNGGKIWVLLVAGSRGYYNYRHQADICHAYHVRT